MTTAKPLETTVPPVYSYRHQFNDVIGVIRDYTPRTPTRFWNDAVQEFTRNVVTELKPDTETDARAYMSVIARLATWTVNIACLPLRAEIVFNGGNIRNFIHDNQAGHAANYLDSQQFRLYRIGRQLGTDVPPVGSNGGRKSGDVFRPYSPHEIIRFRNQAASRSNAPRRHNWTVLLALAAGCGLGSTEIMALPVSSIRIEDDAVRIDVPGPRARTVVCLHSWEDDLRKAVQSPLTDYYIFVRENRATFAHTYVQRYIFRSANSGQSFHIERLRSTWILSHLNAGTPVFPLMRALGVKDVNTLARFERYIDALDDETHTAAFRQARA